MLPILRIVPVGGVLLAIMILVLALNPPDGTRLPLTPAAIYGALMERRDHPEWRQFLMLAATRRADELNRLRDLPDSPVRGGKTPDGSEIAGLPADRAAAEPDDTTGSIPGSTGSTLPIDIGERSSTELPVTKQEEQPPTITPARLKTHNESRGRALHSRRHVAAQAKAAKPNSDPFNLNASPPPAAAPMTSIEPQISFQ